MMSNSGDNRKEVDNLHQLLQQTENLVHELHDELETKDQLTWKNIGSKANGDSSYITPNASSQTQESNKSAKFDSKELEDEKMKNSEAMSRIEAELEAELERLELNMKGSSLGSAYNFFQVTLMGNFDQTVPEFWKVFHHGSSTSISNHKNPPTLI